MQNQYLNLTLNLTVVIFFGALVCVFIAFVFFAIRRVMRGMEDDFSKMEKSISEAHERMMLM
ncbi:MAG: hypothetical protein FWB99_00185, partial [Treponema sp.]|nr:hypothetical protein [Treponema sp.]